MWTANGGYTDIDGFEIDGTSSTSIRVGIYLTGGNSSVKNSSVHHVAQNSGCDSNGGAGLVADQHRGTTFNNYDFIGNIVHHTGGSCGFIHNIYHASSGSIKNNIVYASSGAGINGEHDDHNIEIANNTVFGNAGYGIHWSGCHEAYNLGCPTTGINVYNNIVYDNVGGIQGPDTVDDTGINIVKNNLVFGNATQFDLSSKGLANTSGTIVADPQFVNYIRKGGGDYHLKSTSPAIDKGSSTFAPSTDIDGATRPQGVGVDLGAYEAR
jgi:hypothetical protein